MVIIGISKIFVVGSNPTTPGLIIPGARVPSLRGWGQAEPAPINPRDGFAPGGTGHPPRAHEYKNNKYLAPRAQSATLPRPLKKGPDPGRGAARARKGLPWPPRGEGRRP